jgi:hypothetical protein
MWQLPGFSGKWLSSGSTTGLLTSPGRAFAQHNAACVLLTRRETIALKNERMRKTASLDHGRTAMREGRHEISPGSDRMESGALIVVANFSKVEIATEKSRRVPMKAMAGVFRRIRSAASCIW